MAIRQSVTIRGGLSDRRHIELAEPIEAVGEEVEVIIRPLPAHPAKDVFGFIASLPPASRSKADIDRQIHEERDSWGDR
jgi:hypothetical protein